MPSKCKVNLTPFSLSVFRSLALCVEQQAQRKVLEEQHVAGTGKGTPGVAAVAAPPVKVKEVAKCPKLVPIQTRVVNVPIVALLAPVEVPEPKPMVAALEAEVVAAEVEVEVPVEASVEAEEATLEVEAPIETPDVVDGPVEAPEEVPVVEVPVETAVGPPTEETAAGPPTEETAAGPPTEETAVGPPTEETAVGPPTEETAAVQEVEESFIPKTELVMEVKALSHFEFVCGRRVYGVRCSFWQVGKGLRGGSKRTVCSI
uniref:Uncharacterized protein n=1 Tax=Oncorhynchus tshawytscha TaxID=74940 RepID=A0A8C8IQY9_ONCTS